MLRDDQWERIEQILPGKVSDRGVTTKDNQRFLEVVLWIMRTGSPWREKGVFEHIAQALLLDALGQCNQAIRFRQILVGASCGKKEVFLMLQPFGSGAVGDP